LVRVCAVPEGHVILTESAVAFVPSPKWAFIGDPLVKE
jgi:hypothetical protein